MFKNAQFLDENPPTEQSLRTYLNSGDEVKHLLQAPSQEQKELGSNMKFYYHVLMIAIKRGLHFRILLFLRIWMIYWILVIVWKVIHLLSTVVCKEGRGSKGRSLMNRICSLHRWGK